MASQKLFILDHKILIECVVLEESSETFVADVKVEMVFQSFLKLFYTLKRALKKVYNFLLLFFT